MHRFFVSPEIVAQDAVTLRGPLAHQLGRVLRLRPGAEIALLDDTGWAYRVALEAVQPEVARGRIVARWQPETEPRVAIALYQAVPKGSRFDWALQKATELGVAAIVPLITERMVVAMAEASGEKLARWRRIVQEAAEQAGRARLPAVSAPVPFARACEPPPTGALGLIACLHPAVQPLRAALATLPPESLAAVRLYIGPEGDFSPGEVAQAVKAGLIPISLGPRILRTETAPLAALSAILYALGELDRPAAFQP